MLGMYKGLHVNERQGEFASVKRVDLTCSGLQLTLLQGVCAGNVLRVAGKRTTRGM